MFEPIYLTENLNEKFEQLNRDNVQNFNLRSLFGGKKKSGSEMTDEERAELMMKRRREVAGIQSEMGLLDKITVTPGKPKPAKLPKGFSETKARVREANEKTLLGSLVDALGGALSGETEKAAEWTPEQEAKAKVIGNVTVSGKRELYTRNEKFVFYTILAVLVIIAIILILKRNKK